MKKVQNMSDDDFNRNIYNLLGLCFDAVDMDQTVDLLLNAIEKDQKVFLSTPNLNFLIASQKNDKFRNSVINSDLSIADGMPIIFMCKLLQLPITKRVAGSSLIETLNEDKRCIKNPVKVFFFGGQDGVAEKAHEALNKKKGGLISVGYLNPGFGSIEEMSDQKLLDKINNANPEFLIVSLGAAKGQAWIEANKHRLNANIISHLGAVVNFIAGTVKRAPKWVQNIHMEWVWRIKEEPSLFGRYWSDGLSFLALLFSKIIPYAIIVRRGVVYSTPLIEADFENDILKLKGSITGNVKSLLCENLLKFTSRHADFTIDLKGVNYLDQSVLGIMLLLHKYAMNSGVEVTYTGLSPYLEKIFKLNRLDFLLKYNKNDGKSNI